MFSRLRTEQVSMSLGGRTVDGDLGRPLGGPVQDALLDALHVLSVDHLGDVEHPPDLLEDLRLVPLADLHPVLHGHDDVLRPVLRPRLGALLGRSWRRQGGGGEQNVRVDNESWRLDEESSTPSQPWSKSYFVTFSLLTWCKLYFCIFKPTSLNFFCQTNSVEKIKWTWMCPSHRFMLLMEHLASTSLKSLVC